MRPFSVILSFFVGILLAFAIAVPATAEGPVSVKLFDDFAWRIAISPNGETVAIGEHGPGIVLWNLRTKEIIRRLEGHADNVQSVQFSPDGKTLVSGSNDGTLRFWSAESGELERSVKTVGTATEVCFSPDGKLVAVVFRESKTLQIFDAASGKELRRLELFNDTAIAESHCHGDVLFSPDGKVLVAVCGGRGWPKFVGGDSMISIWEVANWSLRTSFVADRFSIPDLAISPDGQWIAAATGRGKNAKIWKIPKAQPIEKSDPERVDRLIERLDSDDFGEREKAQQELEKIGLAAKDALVEATLGDSAERIFRAKAVLSKLSRTDIQPTHILSGTSYDMHAVAFSPDGKLLATGCSFKRPGHVILWQLGDTPHRIPTPHQQGAWSLEFSPDGRQLVAGQKNGHISVWEVEVPK